VISGFRQQRLVIMEIAVLQEFVDGFNVLQVFISVLTGDGEIYDQVNRGKLES
jgi:hypothetical protein